MEYKNLKVVVIGRPNVGKSTLFNRLIKERKSIVDDVPGVTRDRIYADIGWNGKSITLIDTGGLVETPRRGVSTDGITLEIKKQVFSAISESDFIIFLVDGKSGITSQDEKIAGDLRRIKDKKKIFLAVNKIDTEKQSDLVYEFYSLGLGEPYPISALSGSSGLADILDEITSNVETPQWDVSTNDNAIKIAIVGKPNVGKSSILNSLVGEERSIVTSIPGTTRDSIDTKIKVDSQNYILIDTAGLRRKSKVSSKVERYATTRAISTIENADIVLLVIDVTSEISDQDQKIASLIKRRNKASIILANKYDLLENKDPKVIKILEEQIFSYLHFINYSKLVFTCRGIPWNALNRDKGVSKIFTYVKEAYINYQKRISTGKLNRIFENIIHETSPPSSKGKQLRIYYTTQANVKPPEIVLFVNDSKLVNDQYERFLEKRIRSEFDFSGSPINLVFRNKRK